MRTKASTRAKFTNAFGEVWTDPATLTVDMGPAFLGGIAATTTSPSSDSHLVIRPGAANEPDTQFQWKRDGVAIPGATDRVLDLGRMGPGDAGSYTLVATHPRGTATSSPLLISAPTGAAFTDPALMRHVRPGDSIRLGRQLWAGSVTGYQWLKDGQPIAGATSATLDLAPVTDDAPGDYTLQAVTPQGTLTSKAIAVRGVADPFWSEIPLLAATPARSGGVAAGKVFLFGERWKTSFTAGTLPDHVDVWYGSSDVTNLVAGNGVFMTLSDVAGVGHQVSCSTDGSLWHSLHPRGLTPGNLAFGNGVFIAGPMQPADPGQPLDELSSSDGVHWNIGDMAWAGVNPAIGWLGLSLAFGNGHFVALDQISRLINSTDGHTWTGTTANGLVNPNQDLAFNGNRFVRVMGTSTVEVSTDGVTWTEQPVVAAEWTNFTHIIGGDGWFAARMSGNRVGLSRDGVSWELLPTDAYGASVLVGIGGDHLYAIRSDGVPLVSRALGTIAVVAQPARTFRVSGLSGNLTINATAGGSNLSYQWYRGASGDTSSPIAGATGPKLTIASGDGIVEAWVRVTDGTRSRDSVTGRDGLFEPGWFLQHDATSTTAAWVRPDGNITWLGHATIPGSFEHLRQAPLFGTESIFKAASETIVSNQRDSSPVELTRQTDDAGVSFIYPTVGPHVRLDDSDRVSGTLPTGYYRGGIPAERAAELDALLLPDGHVLLGLQTADDVLSGDAVATADGHVTFDFGTSGQVQLVFNQASGRFSGTWTRTGDPDRALRGVRDNTDDGIVLANLSGRAWLPGANQVTIGGFVVQGAGKQRVVARGVGPGLRPYDVTDAAAHPTIRLFRGSTLLLENTRWSTDPRHDEIADIGGQLGAFPLDPAEDDSAFIAELDQGGYTFHVLDPTGGGTALAELYFDRGFSGNGRLVNISTRGWVDNRGAVVIAGFSITGNGPREVLLRGIGPALLDYGVGDAATAVQIELFREQQSLLQKRGWAQLDVPESVYPAAGEYYMRTAMASVGAFPLTHNPAGGTGDAALLVWLEPGNYTLVVRNDGATGGTALGEVYDVPFDADR